MIIVGLENPLVCTEQIHMLQQGNGVLEPNSVTKFAKDVRQHNPRRHHKMSSCPTLFLQPCSEFKFKTYEKLFVFVMFICHVAFCFYAFISCIYNLNSKLYE